MTRYIIIPRYEGQKENQPKIQYAKTEPSNKKPGILEGFLVGEIFGATTGFLFYPFARSFSYSAAQKNNRNRNSR